MICYIIQLKKFEITLLKAIFELYFKNFIATFTYDKRKSTLFKIVFYSYDEFVGLNRIFRTVKHGS